MYYQLLFQDCKRDACCQGGHCLKTCFKTNKCDKVSTIGGITKVSNHQCFEGFCRRRCREDFECHGGRIPFKIFCASWVWNPNSTKWKPSFFQYIMLSSNLPKLLRTSSKITKIWLSKGLNIVSISDFFCVWKILDYLGVKLLFMKNLKFLIFLHVLFSKNVLNFCQLP